MSNTKFDNKCFQDLGETTLISSSSNTLIYKFKHDKKDYISKIYYLPDIQYDKTEIKKNYKVSDDFLNLLYPSLLCEKNIYQEFKNLKNMVKFYGSSNFCKIPDDDKFKDFNDNIKEFYPENENNGYSMLFLKYCKNINFYDLIENMKDDTQSIIKLFSDILIQVFILFHQIYQKYPGFIHSDLNIDNILIIPKKYSVIINDKKYEFNHQIKVIDFEFSSVFDEDKDKTIINIAYNYFNPELFISFIDDSENERNYKFDVKELKKYQNKDFIKLIVMMIGYFFFEESDKIDEIKEHFNSLDLFVISKLIDAIRETSIINNNISLDCKLSDVKNFGVFKYAVEKIYDLVFDIQDVFKDLKLK